jgi:hypothetical protein
VSEDLSFLVEETFADLERRLHTFPPSVTSFTHQGPGVLCALKNRGPYLNLAVMAFPDLQKAFTELREFPEHYPSLTHGNEVQVEAFSQISYAEAQSLAQHFHKRKIYLSCPDLSLSEGHFWSLSEGRGEHGEWLKIQFQADPVEDKKKLIGAFFYTSEEMKNWYLLAELIHAFPQTSKVNALRLSWTIHEASNAWFFSILEQAFIHSEWSVDLDKIFHLARLKKLISTEKISICEEFLKTHFLYCRWWKEIFFRKYVESPTFPL